MKANIVPETNPVPISYLSLVSTPAEDEVVLSEASQHTGTSRMMYGRGDARTQ